MYHRKHEYIINIHIYMQGVRIVHSLLYTYKNRYPPFCGSLASIYMKSIKLYYIYRIVLSFMKNIYIYILILIN